MTYLKFSFDVQIKTEDAWWRVFCNLFSTFLLYNKQWRIKLKKRWSIPALKFILLSNLYYWMIEKKKSRIEIRVGETKLNTKQKVQNGMSSIGSYAKCAPHQQNDTTLLRQGRMYFCWFSVCGFCGGISVAR